MILDLSGQILRYPVKAYGITRLSVPGFRMVLSCGFKPDDLQLNLWCLVQRSEQMLAPHPVLHFRVASLYTGIDFTLLEGPWTFLGTATNALRFVHHVFVSAAEVES